METRKTKRADLEKKRPVFLQLGLILALGAALAAFEWKTPDIGNIDLPERIVFEPDPGFIQIVREKKELPKPVNTTLIKLVDNIRDDIPALELNIEIDPNAEVEHFLPTVQLADEPTDISDEPFVVVEDMPEFPGGHSALMKYLATNIVYPKQAREAGIKGTVYVTFVIEPDGSVSSVVSLRGVPGGCTEEAERVVKSMPDWEPGKQRGKAVRVRLNLPVKFNLLD
jgi:protein TonB